MTPKQMKDGLFSAFFLIFLIFLVTAAITLLGITDVIKIRDGYLTALFTSLILELVAAMIALFKSAKFFDDKSPQTLDEYAPSGDALRLLATLWKYQKEHFPNSGAERWGFSISPQSSDFAAFLAGLSELVSYKLVEVQADKWMCGLSTLGMQTCPKWEGLYKNAATFIVT